MPATASDTVVVRRAVAADRHELDRLAALDSAPPLRGDVLVTESDGVLRAALALADGRFVADPFAPTAAHVDLLRTHAASLAGRRHHRRSHVRRPSLA